MKICKLLFKINAVIFSCLLAQYVYAAGYQIFEQNTSDLGRAYASSAAADDDASIEYNNPAAMTLINRPSLAISAVVIDAHSRFSGDSATDRHGRSVIASVKTENPLGTNVIPTLHYVHPINNKFTFGFGITEPFGLDSSYDNEGMARYFATESKITTVNLNPSIAYAITDNFSLGGGLSAQYLSATLNGKSDTTGASATDLSVDNSANDWGYGVNLGLMYKILSNTVVGFSYRSEVHHHASGDYKVTNSSGVDLRKDTVKANLNFPETYMLSVRHVFNDKWTTAATVSYTYWSRFNYLKLTYDEHTSNDIVVHENFHNSVRYALGTDYRLNDKWLLRFGTAYDNSPVGDQDRNAALPDTDRFWLSCGANYAFNRDVSLDVGYAHLFLISGTINQQSGSATLVGHYNNTYANLAGVQLNWKF